MPIKHPGYVGYLYSFVNACIDPPLLPSPCQSYILLISMEEPVQMMNVINRARVRMRKQVHHAHEACAAEGGLGKRGREGERGSNLSQGVPSPILAICR